MPFTPFHMGPGLALKAVAGERFSLCTFGLAQVAIDLEPGIGMVRGAETLHGWTHTYAGAAVIALAVAAVARPLCKPFVARWNREVEGMKLAWLRAEERVPAIAVASGAFVGTFSHVALDSVMHADMHPLAPLSQANALLGTLPHDALVPACVVAGVLGLALWIGRRALRARVVR